MYFRDGNKKRFTLVELLVVISILSIMMGLLFPVLSKAREAACAARCASNLRQVAFAAGMYSEDYRGYFLPGRYASLAWYEIFIKFEYLPKGDLFDCQANDRNTVRGYDNNGYRPSAWLPAPLRRVYGYNFKLGYQYPAGNFAYPLRRRSDVKDYGIQIGGACTAWNNSGDMAGGYFQVYYLTPSAGSEIGVPTHTGRYQTWFYDNHIGQHTPTDIFDNFKGKELN
jgi:prepilin-type N-terminal cleavage/methylation domain-containing protein